MGHPADSERECRFVLIKARDIRHLGGADSAWCGQGSADSTPFSVRSTRSTLPQVSIAARRARQLVSRVIS